MEYSLAQSLEGFAEITNHPFPRIYSDPSVDFVNPGLGQIVNLYDTFVPIRGHSVYTIEKKVETSDEIEKNLSQQLKNEPIQKGFGESKLEPEILNSFMNLIITDSITFPEDKDDKKSRKRKEFSSSVESSPPKKKKSDHKFRLI